MPRVRSQKGVVKPSVQKDEITKLQVYNPGPSVIELNDVVRLVGLQGNVHMQAQPTVASDAETERWLATHQIPVGEYGRLARWRLLVEQDTAAAVLYDPVYLSDAVAGGWTLTAPATAVIIGHVLAVDAAEGAVLLHDLNNGLGNIDDFLEPNEWFIDQTQVLDIVRRVAPTITDALTNSTHADTLIRLRSDQLHLWNGLVTGAVPVNVTVHRGEQWVDDPARPPDLRFVNGILQPTVASSGQSVYTLRGLSVDFGRLETGMTTTPTTVIAPVGEGVALALHDCYVDGHLVLDKTVANVLDVFAVDCSTTIDFAVLAKDTSGLAGGAAAATFQRCDLKGNRENSILGWIGHGGPGTASTGSMAVSFQDCTLEMLADNSTGDLAFSPFPMVGPGSFKFTRTYLKIDKRATFNLFVDAGAGGTSATLDKLDIEVGVQDLNLASRSWNFLQSGSTMTITALDSVRFVNCDEQVFRLPADAPDGCLSNFDETRTETLRKHIGEAPTQKSVGGYWFGDEGRVTVYASTTTGAPTADLFSPNNTDVTNIALLTPPANTLYYYHVKGDLAAHDGTLVSGFDGYVEGVVVVDSTGTATVRSEQKVDGSQNTGAAFDSTIFVLSTPPRVRIQVNQGGHNADCEWRGDIHVKATETPD